jgi:hypothetical protein
MHKNNGNQDVVKMLEEFNENIACNHELDIETALDLSVEINLFIKKIKEYQDN